MLDGASADLGAHPVGGLRAAESVARLFACVAKTWPPTTPT